MWRLKFDFHAGAAYWRGGGSSADEVFDCAVVLAWFALVALAVMAWQDKVVLRYSNAASDKNLEQGKWPHWNPS